MKEFIMYILFWIFKILALIFVIGIVLYLLILLLKKLFNWIIEGIKSFFVALKNVVTTLVMFPFIFVKIVLRLAFLPILLPFLPFIIIYKKFIKKDNKNDNPSYSENYYVLNKRTGVIHPYNSSSSYDIGYNHRKIITESEADEYIRKNPNKYHYKYYN